MGFSLTPQYLLHPPSLLLCFSGSTPLFFKKKKTSASLPFHSLNLLSIPCPPPAIFHLFPHRTSALSSHSPVIFCHLPLCPLLYGHLLSRVIDDFQISQSFNCCRAHPSCLSTSHGTSDHLFLLETTFLGLSTFYHNSYYFCFHLTLLKSLFPTPVSNFVENWHYTDRLRFQYFLRVSDVPGEPASTFKIYRLK